MKKIRFNWIGVIMVTWFATLFVIAVTATIIGKTKDLRFTKQQLKDGETLIIWFREPIEERLADNPDLSITNDDINWYRIKDDHFILDYKHDLGTYYINIDFIAIWGIER